MNNFLWINGFTIFGLQIKFYGIFMATAFVVGLLLVQKFCKWKGYNENLPFDLILVVFPSAIVGARLNYVLFTLGERTWTFAEILAIWNGGLMIYGGIIFSVIALAIYCAIKKVNLVKIMDLIAPVLILGQAIGRWGNFFNQEAYGSLITNKNLQWFPFGVYIENSFFTDDARQQLFSYYGTTTMSGAWFNATFFYESLWCLGGFILLYFLYKKTNKIGLCTATYLAYYGFERFFVEMLRTDSLYLGGIKISVLISAVIFILGVAYLVYLFFKEKNMKNSLIKVEETSVSEKKSSLEENLPNNDVKEGDKEFDKTGNVVDNKSCEDKKSGKL